jgi:hypothetical protein
MTEMLNLQHHHLAFLLRPAAISNGLEQVHNTANYMLLCRLRFDLSNQREIVGGLDGRGRRV